MDWTVIAVLTRLPATIAIEPTERGLPESLYIRVILLKKNKEIGQYSTMMRVTISAE